MEGKMYTHESSSFENPIFYRVDSTYGFGGRDGLMMKGHLIGKCGGSSRVYPEPLWIGGRADCSYDKDQLASFLDDLRPSMPMLSRHFPLRATWKLTLAEQGALGKFNAEFARALTTPCEVDARLLVLNMDGYVVWVQDEKFIVERWFGDERKWKVVDEQPALLPEQADEALAEWNRRTALKTA